MIRTVSQKPPGISFSFLLNQQARPILVLLLCTWVGSLQAKAAFLSWGAALTMVGGVGHGPWGWITLWVSMSDCRASVSSGSAPRKRSVCSASESHSNSMWTVSRNSSAWSNQAHKTEPLSAAKVLDSGECPAKDLCLNSLVRHSYLMTLSKPHKGHLSFVDLWKPTELFLSYEWVLKFCRTFRISKFEFMFTLRLAGVDSDKETGMHLLSPTPGCPVKVTDLF